MKNFTSKTDMEQVFQKLANIKKVEPSADLYFAINSRIKSRDVISLSWIRAAAAIFILLFASEMMIVGKEYTKSTTNELSSLVPQTNNLLYNE